MSTAESSTNHGFLSEFLNDYFVECDEHLTLIRRHLLALESYLNQPRIDGATLDALFRSFHTLKGLSGMVGAQEAEQLAHQMESYLRVLRDDHLTLTAEGMDALLVGTKVLEQIIAERREQRPTSDINPILTQFAALVSKTSETAARPAENQQVKKASSNQVNAEAQARMAAAIASGMKLWQFAFAPLPELAVRGINVNVVRARLVEIGELIQATPRLLPQGAIAFDFLVASHADETVFADWQEDGLTYHLYDPLPPVPDPLPPADIQATNGDAPSSAVSQPLRTLASAHVVRVDLARLDELMRMVGELVISRSRLDDNLQRLEDRMPAPDWRPLQETNLAMERQLRDLREGVMRVRMVPIGEIFERMQFVVRDLERETQKKVILERSGEHTEVDKLLVERMMDPILHLVRNAVSHGIEPASERLAMGKPAAGTIALRASAVAERVLLEIEDDGRGIDAQQVARRAHSRGLLDAEAVLDSAALLDIICLPGFSTREEADRASGRGVGMGVVKNTIMGLGGTFELDTEVGRGTRFTIELPLTLAIAEALIVSVANQRFAVAQSSVREVIEIDSRAVKHLENNEVMAYRGEVLPLLRLARLFGLPEHPRANFHGLIIGSGLNAVCLAVDRILGQREIVVRALGDPLIQVSGLAGATELGDGQIILILDAAALAHKAGRRFVENSQGFAKTPYRRDE